jgi:ATP-binding cassette subfamily B multidrug efflux pump
MLPFLAWLACYIGALWYFVPRLGKVGKAQADARALMTGRITDAYTNIATVKLFSHTQREAGFAREAMRSSCTTGYRQMRLVSAFEIVNHTLVHGPHPAGMAGYGAVAVVARPVGVGAVAAATAMALRSAACRTGSCGRWPALFENIGTVQDGIEDADAPAHRARRAGCQAVLHVPRGEVRFEHASFGYGEPARRVIDDLNLTVKPGEKIGLVGRSGAGKSTLVNLLLRFYDLDGGRILIDGQDIAHVTQDSLRATSAWSRRTPRCCTARCATTSLRPARRDARKTDRGRARRAEAHDFIQTPGRPAAAGTATRRTWASAA